jgi:hypothetical protein
MIPKPLSPVVVKSAASTGASNSALSPPIPKNIRIVCIISIAVPGTAIKYSTCRRRSSSLQNSVNQFIIYLLISNNNLRTILFYIINYSINCVLIQA